MRTHLLTRALPLWALLLSLSPLALQGCEDDAPGCGSDSDCRAGRICVARACQDPDDDVDAGNNGIDNNGVDNNGIDNNGVVNNGVVNNGVVNNGDIDAGNNGVVDVIEPECLVDGDCGAGLYCEPDTNTCEPGCRPGQCGQGVCDLETRQCVTEGCASDADCGQAEYCGDQGVCLQGCRQGGCPVGLSCDLDTHQCVADGCNGDGDCPADAWCSADGSCEPGCRQDGCDAGFSCDLDTRQCLPVGCTADIDCDADAYCDGDGQCVAGCRSGGCGMGQACDLDTRQCVPVGCMGDADCAADAWCTPDGACATGCRVGGCPNGQSCDPGSRQCVMDGCMADAECPATTYCAASGECVDGCRLGGCPAFQQCSPTTRQCEPLAVGPEFDVQPTEVDFGSVPVNTSVFEELVVSNLGTEELVLFNVTFGRGPTSEGFQIIPPSPDLPVIVAPGESVVYTVRFEPRRVTSNGQSYFNQVVFETNDADEGRVEVPIVGLGEQADGPCLRFAERVVDFGFVAPGEVATREVALQNCGMVAIDVASIALEGDDDGVFSLLVGGNFPRTIPAGQTLNVVINYVPVAVASQQVNLVATAGDLTALAVVVADGPCLRFSPSRAEFGFVAPGEVASQQLRLENCGPAPIEVTGVNLTGDADGVFSVVIGGNFPRSLAAGAGIGVVVNYEPVGYEAQSATLVAATTGTASAQAAVVADAATCPEAVLVGSAGNTGGPVQGQLQGTVGVEVRVDGSNSFDPAAGALTYTWSVESPDGSMALAQAPASDVESFAFTPDVAGTYTIGLSVTSEATGLEACEPATLRVVVPSVEVRLTWNDRSDLDLHVVRGDANGFSRIGSSQQINPEDCYFANPAPDWGVSGDVADDPAFLGDDVDGFGPEVTIFPSIEPARRYQVVVRMSRPFFQPTNLTLAITVDGVTTTLEQTMQGAGTEAVLAVIEGDGTVVPQN